MVWGCSFILIKKALLGFSPIQVASLRLSISALAFLPFFLREASKVKPGEWITFIAVGLTGSGIPAFCYALAQTKISSITAGIMNSTTPLFTFVLGVLFFRTASSVRRVIGVLLGLGGACTIILGSRMSESGAGQSWFAAFILVGTICYAISGNVVKARLQHWHSVSISALSFGSLLIPALVLLFATGSIQTLQANPAAFYSLAAIAALALVGTVMATILYFKLVQRTDALFASTVSYLIPIVALMLGLLDGERLSWMEMMGLVLIVGGVYLARIRLGRPVPDAE